MDLKDRVVVITGGGGGIGSTVARKFKTEGAAALVIVDRDEASATAVADELEGWGVGLDVTDGAAIARLVSDTEERYGPIDIFFSNAGAGEEGSVADGDLGAWQRQWDLHVMSHVHTARAVVPSMRARGEGYLLHTASAAGLLAAVGSAPYSVTKAACIALAEHESITYGDDGIRVSVLCPQGVNTAMAPRQLGDGGTDGIIEADEVADIVFDAVVDERFLILPHPEVATYVERKATDRDRWLSGMRRLRQRSLDLLS